MQELEQEPNFSESGFIGRPTPAASNSILLVPPISTYENRPPGRFFIYRWALSTTATAAVAPLTSDQRVAAAIEARDIGALRDALRAGGQPNGNMRLVGSLGHLHATSGDQSS